MTQEKIILFVIFSSFGLLVSVLLTVSAIRNMLEDLKGRIDEIGRATARLERETGRK
jgi:hypothetical protein